jgi:beta-glucosidase
VTLAPGERRTLTFTLGPEALRLTDEQMNRVVEPGLFDVMIGTNSVSLTKASLEVVVQ